MLIMLVPVAPHVLYWRLNSLAVPFKTYKLFFTLKRTWRYSFSNLLCSGERPVRLKPAVLLLAQSLDPWGHRWGVPQWGTTPRFVLDVASLWRSWRYVPALVFSFSDLTSFSLWMSDKSPHPSIVVVFLALQFVAKISTFKTWSSLSFIFNNCYISSKKHSTCSLS